MNGFSDTDIPIGAENAITRAELARKWGVSDREARRIVAALRADDNGDGYVIVSHSRGGVHGYYRTNDTETIRRYVNEVHSRAQNTFLPLRKAWRVMIQNENRELYGEGLGS